MFFEKKVSFRLRKEHIKLIEKIVRKDRERYDNESHFLRCAALKLLREERARLDIR